MKSRIGNPNNVHYAFTAGLAAMSIALACTIMALMPSKAFAAIDEVEDNDTFETATSINMNQSVYGVFSNNYDKDYYKVNLPQSGTIKITFTNDQRSDDGYLDSKYVYDKYFDKVGYLSFDSSPSFSSTRPVSATMQLKKGMNYLYFEACWLESNNHPYHFKLTYVIPGTTISKVTPAKKAFTVKWTKKSGAAKYQIRYSTKKSMSGAKTITVKKSLKSKKIKSLKKNKKYYVQVRVAKNIGGQIYYSSWSSKKSVKTKK